MKSARERFDEMSKESSAAAMPEDADVSEESGVVLDGDQIGGGEPTAEAEADGGEMPPEEAVDPREAEYAQRMADMDAREQKLRSWEGRQAKSAAAAVEGGEEFPQPEGEAEPLVGGDDDNLAAIASDFGDDFAERLRRLIQAETQLKIDELRAQVKEAFGNVTGFLNRQQKKAVDTAHPDAQELMKGPYWDKWLASLGGAEREEAEEVFMDGSWPEIVETLNRFKAWVGKQAKAEESGAQDPLNVDAMVSSSGSAVRPATGGTGAKDARALFNELASVAVG